MTQDASPQSDADRDADEALRRFERAGRIKNVIAAAIALSAILGISWFLLADPITRALRSLPLEWSEHERLAEMTTLERVHAELLPAWVIALSNNRSGQAEARAFQELREALAQDPDAVTMLEQLRERVTAEEGLAAASDDIFETVQIWNRAMDHADQPWWIDANIMTGSRRPVFYIKSYKILADFQVTVGDTGAWRTRIGARADNTNVREGFLGHTTPHQDGAMILADRLYDFSLREVWPLLAAPAHADDLTPRQRAFAPKVRAEVAAHLPEEAFARLAQHAPTRLKLERTLEAVRNRADCGSTFSITDLPWDGMPPDQIDLLRQYADRDRFTDCPAITDTEINAIVDTSEALREDTELQRAAEHLVAFVSRPIAVHEARHVADNATADAFTTPLPCARCDAHKMGRSARAEASAYLATFASGEAPYTALYQVCGLDFTRRSAHVVALRLILSDLGVACTRAPPEEIAPQAAALEEELFGRSDPVTLPRPTYPERLELYR